jgi:hypothetical protein
MRSLREQDGKRRHQHAQATRDSRPAITRGHALHDVHARTPAVRQRPVEQHAGDGVDVLVERRHRVGVQLSVVSARVGERAAVAVVPELDDAVDARRPPAGHAVLVHVLCATGDRAKQPLKWFLQHGRVALEALRPPRSGHSTTHRSCAARLLKVSIEKLKAAGRRLHPHSGVSARTGPLAPLSCARSGRSTAAPGSKAVGWAEAGAEVGSGVAAEVMAEALVVGSEVIAAAAAAAEEAEIARRCAATSP